MSGAVNLKSLENYLQAKGWALTKFTEDLQKVQIEANGEKMQLTIPNTGALEDYEYRIQSFLQSLSFIEGRNREDIIDDIESVGYDLMKVRFMSPTTEDGTIPFVNFVSAVDDVQRLLKFGASSAVTQKTQFKGRLPLPAPALLQNCDFVRTEAGSFVITIRVPQPDTYLDKDEKEYVADYGRKTISHIMNGLEEANKLAVDDQFKDTYDLKLSTNALTAVADLIERNEDTRIEITAKWNTLVKTNQPEPPPAILDKESGVKFRAMAVQLKDIPQDEATTIKGIITSLVMEKIEHPNESRLAVIYSKERNLNVYVNLKGKNHEEACDAYKENKAVSVAGTLTKKAMHWVLENPKTLKISKP